MTLADDLLDAFDRPHVLGVAEWLDGVLADEAIPNAEFKGMLNRTLGPAWGVQYQFAMGSRGARQFLEAARDAMRRWSS